MPLDIRPVIEQYDASCQPTAIEYLAGSGGFSGSRFWRLHTPRGTLALRQFAAGLTDTKALVDVWRCLSAASRQSLGYRLPVAILNRGGLPFVEHRGRLWDLCDWLPGQAVPEERVTEPHVTRAMIAVAKFHAALDRIYPEARATPLDSAAVRLRIERLESLQNRHAAQIVAQVHSTSGREPFWCHTADTLKQWFDQESARLHDALRDTPRRVTAGMIIGDVWRDNVLFDDHSEVVSLLDFSRFVQDTTATDIARLLGSMIAGHPEWWRVGVDAYTSIRPLTVEQQELTRLLDRANVLLSAWNWLEWLFVERRTFDDRPAIEARVRHFLTRLPEVFGP